MTNNDRPRTLSELVRLDLAGYRLRETYYLQLTHGLMGFFPAIMTSDRTMLVCESSVVALRIAHLLPEREHTIEVLRCLVDEARGVAFSLESKDGFETKALTYIDANKFFTIDANQERELAFKWAPGLL